MLFSSGEILGHYQKHSIAICVHEGSDVAFRKLESPAEQSAGKDAALERERAETAALQISLDAANETCRNLQREIAFANKRYI